MQQPGQQPGAPANPLPVRSVTLYTAGVGYTERGGEVDGNATMQLTFRTPQINDILKSLVLVDTRGKVQPAVYAAKDPIARTLQAFSIDVSSNLSQQELLSKLRGMKASIESTGKPAVTGQIVGVETRQVAGDDAKPVTVPFLTVLADSGIVTLRLDAEKSIRLLDERLNREFREALSLLASGSDDQRRQVTLRFTGEGKRQVRVGYVTEAPLWKTTYRLVLGSEESAKPYIQGWALVENTTDDDWVDVQLNLVSGRPISFIQDLYQPLYVPRPVVAVDVAASPYPQTHGANMEAESVAPPAAAAGPAAGMRRSLSAKGGGRMAGGMGGFGGGAAMADAMPSAPDSYAAGIVAAEMAASVATAAQGGQVGELTEYRIKVPVSLPRQQAAMIPIVTGDFTAEKVSLLELQGDARHPLNSLRLKNSTGLMLKGGPVAIFDSGAYAGDARLEDLRADESRLISYGVDLAVDAERLSPAGAVTLTNVSIKRGVMVVTQKQRDERRYGLKSRADKPRTVVIEHPYDPAARLVEPAKPDERTTDRYRFNVTLPAGKNVELKVVTERPISSSVQVFESDVNYLGTFTGRKELSAKLREALASIIERRAKINEQNAIAAARDAEIAQTSADQERIRKNMEALDRASALYKRYVEELDGQENRIQTARKEATTARAESARLTAELRTYTDGLNLEE